MIPTGLSLSVEGFQFVEAAAELRTGSTSSIRDFASPSRLFVTGIRLVRASYFLLFEPTVFLDVQRRLASPVFCNEVDPVPGPIVASFLRGF